ncbi:glycosyl transferase, group 1 [hydrocarbon metagenome]|uniref:Glycosyl transferase, group 1 n=1 Tax=hydrocarbon metagenome TaxID=938273 RepID=A0A0W8FHC5_9ZZZZ
MPENNLLVISNSFPDQENSYITDIFVKEQIRYIKDYFDHVYVFSPVAYGMEQFRKTRHTDYQFDNVRVFFPKYVNNPLFWYFGRPMWVDREVKAITSLIEKEQLHFDLIHAHYTWPSGAAGVRLKEKYAVPVVITEHTSNTLKKAIETQDAIFTKTWSNADTIIRVKKSDASAFGRMQIPLQNIISIPNGYDSKKFHPIDAQKCRETLQLPRDTKIILNVGNLYGEVKGHRYLVEAVSKIVAQQKEFLCIIIGDGKLRNTLEHRIRSFGLEEHVLLTGGKQHTEIPLWMNACDLFVLPSLNEGNPTVMFEALGCGKPFVGTRVGGVPEVITSDKYGLLVEPAKPVDLAEMILVALEREWDREAILAHAGQFTWESIAKEITGVYARVLG